MSDDSSGSSGLKSAYEAALERLEARGIAAPDSTSLSDEARRAVAEERAKADAKLAELEIMHSDKIRDMVDAIERSEAEQRYVADRQRIRDDLERRIARLREAP